MARRLIALAGLFCMLLHAGLVVAHHALPGDRAHSAAESVSVAEISSQLAQALMASMCRGGAAAGDFAPAPPSEPAGHDGLCVICCCPAATTLILANDAPDSYLSLERQQDRVSWQVAQFAVRARVAERPPVRGPPVVV